jgi:hypothetical protein
MQAIFIGAHWFRFWALLQCEDKRETFQRASKALEVIALDVFAKHGWQSNNRLCL